MESHKIRDYNQIVVRRSPVKTVLGLVVSLLLVALIAFVALMVASRASAPFAYLTASDAVIILIFVAAGAVMSTALLVFYTRQLVSPYPLLVIDSEGITDHASCLSVGTIRWEEIAAIFATNRYLVIVPRDMESILARQSSIKRAVLSTNVQFNRIMIPGLLMSTSARAILTQAMTIYSNNILEHGIRIDIAR
jgi:CDP-diglyceride synthetase